VNQLTSLPPEVVSSQFLVEQETNMAKSSGISYRDLVVWKKSIELAKKVYVLTKIFPRDETYGLVQQARRSAVSIAANIAEGQGRNGRREFIQFVGIARGSLTELQTHLVIAGKLGYLHERQLLDVLGDAEIVYKLLNGLKKGLERHPTNT
jgi:four helix bundle protein